MKFVQKKVLITLGMLVMIALIVGIVYQRSLHHAKLGKSQAKLRSHLQALHMYAAHNANSFPTEELWPRTLLETGLLSDFHMKSEFCNEPGEAYVYIDGVTPFAESQILVYENPLHWNQGVLTGFANLNVEVIDHDTFERMLADQMRD